MKHIHLTLMLFAVISLASIKPAEAGTFRFGTSQSIKKIQDVPLKGPQGESLYLGYMIETHFFGLGTHMTDGGYVLGVTGDFEKYLPMPEAGKVSMAQASGALPNPLPPYEIGLLDYLIGYSLWLTILALLIWYGGKRALQRQ